MRRVRTVIPSEIQLAESINIVRKKRKQSILGIEHAILTDSSTTNPLRIERNKEYLKKGVFSYSLLPEQQAQLEDLISTLHNNPSLIVYPARHAHLSIAYLSGSELAQFGPIVHPRILEKIRTELNSVISQLKPLPVNFKPYLITRHTVLLPIEYNLATYARNQLIIGEVIKGVLTGCARHPNPLIRKNIPFLGFPNPAVIKLANFKDLVTYDQLAQEGLQQVIDGAKVPEAGYLNQITFSQRAMFEDVLTVVDEVKFDLSR